MARGTITQKRILLVEADPPIRNLIRMVLAQGHYVVVEAQNGVEALAMFKKQQFDLVLTDLDMPEMAGDRLVVEIKRLIPTQPIILMTANRGGLQGIEQFPNVILDKPFPFPSLQTAITDVFG